MNPWMIDDVGVELWLKYNQMKAQKIIQNKDKESKQP